MRDPEAHRSVRAADFVLHQIRLFVVQPVGFVLVNQRHGAVPSKYAQPRVQQFALTDRANDGLVGAFELHGRSPTLLAAKFAQKQLKGRLNRR